MLGDLNIAEPKALIGFAGPRVIEQTIKQTLPEGFQRSEFLLAHGMVDKVVPRDKPAGLRGPQPGLDDPSGAEAMTEPALPHLQAWRRGATGASSAGWRTPGGCWRALGQPAGGLPRWCSLAGTNGKGSTGAFLAHALQACGHPDRLDHLAPPGLPRPSASGSTAPPWMKPALDRLLAEAFAAEAALGLQATYFELMIAAAFLAFREAGIGLDVVEVGMGGRWDATNASDPLLTILTNVELDHMQLPGPHPGGHRPGEALHRPHGPAPGAGPRPGPRPGSGPCWNAARSSTPPRRCEADSPGLGPQRGGGPPASPWPAAPAGQPGHRLGGPARPGPAGLPSPEAPAWAGIEATTWPGRLWAVPGPAERDHGRRPQPRRRPVPGRPRPGHRGPSPPVLQRHGRQGSRRHAGRAAAMEPASVTLVRGENPRYATAEALRASGGRPGSPGHRQAAARRLREPGRPPPGWSAAPSISSATCSGPGLGPPSDRTWKAPACAGAFSLRHCSAVPAFYVFGSQSNTPGQECKEGVL